MPFWTATLNAQTVVVSELEQEIQQRAAQIESKLIAWRRDIHENPELASRKTVRPALSPNI
jgi:amidohydrolase